MQQNYEALYKAVVTAVLEIEPLLEATKQSKPTSVGDLADKLFALRECEKRLKDLRQDVSRIEEVVEKLFVAVYLASSQSVTKVETEYVTAEPIPKLGTRVPRRHEPAFKELMTFLGVPEALVDHEVLDVRFPGWCSYYTSLQAQGKDVPEGLKSALTEYEMSMVKTRKRQSMKGSIDVQGTNETRSADEASVPF